MAKWIDGGNQYVLPYIIATLLSISYPIGIIINYFLQLVLKVKNYFLHKLVDRNTKDSSISLQNYVKILCRDSSGVIIRELEVKYGFLVFWRLCAFAMLFVALGFYRMLSNNLTGGYGGFLVSLILLIILFFTYMHVKRQHDKFGESVMAEMKIDRTG